MDARWPVAAWLALLLAAVALSFAAAVDDVLPGELRVVREVQEWRWLGGRFADVVRFLTTTQVVAVAGVSAAGALWLRGDNEGALAIALAVILLLITQPSVTDLVDRPRPSEDLLDIRGSITSPSFPAGHIMSPTAVYGTLAALSFTRPQWSSTLRVALPTATVMLLVASGLVNLYLGVHWPADVLGGYVWGAVIVGAALGSAALVSGRVARNA
jgi:undecaprenyl-diphosphatase